MASVKLHCVKCRCGDNLAAIHVDIDLRPYAFCWLCYHKFTQKAQAIRREALKSIGLSGKKSFIGQDYTHGTKLGC